MPTDKKHQVDEFEQLYLKEKKKGLVLTAATIIFAATTAGSLVWGINKQSTDMPSSLDTSTFSQGQSRGGPGNMQMDITSFFNDDGSIDTDSLSELTSRSPLGMDSRFVEMIQTQADQAVEDGDITQEQANALLDEIEALMEESNDD